MYDLCPLSDCQISENYLTYRSVQILKIRSGGQKALKSNPQQKFMRNWIYYSTWLKRSFPPDQYDQSKMFCISIVPEAYRRDRPLNICG